MSDIQKMIPPIDVLSLEFADDEVVVTFADPQRSNRDVMEIRTLRIARDIAEVASVIQALLEDTWELVDLSEQLQRGAPPRTRPSRGAGAGG